MLTSAQRSELHSSILAYLKSQPSFPAASAAFADELSSVETGAAAAASVAADTLEKRWVSVLRLQRKVLDLEERLSQAQSLAGNANHGRAPLSSAPSGSAVSHYYPEQPALHTLSGHRAPVTSLSIHPVYALLASASEDATVRLWDLESGSYDRSLRGHSGPLTCLAFDPSGSFLATASADTTIRLWRVDAFRALDGNDGDKACLVLRGHEHAVSGVAFTSSPGSLPPKSGSVAVRASLPVTSSSSSSSSLLSASSNTVSVGVLVSVSRDGSLRVWDPHSGTCLRIIHPTSVASVAAVDSGIGSQKANSNWIKCVSSVECTSRTSLETGIQSPESVVAAGMADHTVRIFRVPKSASSSANSDSGCISILSQHSHIVECVAIAPGPHRCTLAQTYGFHKNTTATASSTDAHLAGSTNDNAAVDSGHIYVASGSRDRNIVLWRVPVSASHSASGAADSQVLCVLSGHENWVRSVVFHPENPRLLLSSSDDKSIRIWDLSTGRCVRKITQAHDHFVQALGMASWGTLSKHVVLASAGVDAKIKIWECR
eukprot:ANDGO_04332.mRNA.1 Lissencephaly-1 homolog